MECKNVSQYAFFFASVELRRTDVIIYTEILQEKPRKDWSGGYIDFKIPGYYWRVAGRLHQSTRPSGPYFASSQSLAFLKWPLPKNPLEALSGDGCCQR